MSAKKKPTPPPAKTSNRKPRGTNPRLPVPAAEKALVPFPPPNIATDLLQLREEAGVQRFASKFISAEEVEYLRTAQKGNQLSADEKIVILEMATAGLSPTVIGERIGRGADTIRRCLEKYRPKNIIARAYLENQSERMARSIVKHGTVEEHMEVMHRIGVLPKPTDKAAPQAQFNIVVGAASGGPTAPSQATIEAALKG